MTATNRDNPNGLTCVATVSDNESPVYLRNFGNLIHLVDASGKPLGQQVSLDIGPYAADCVQEVTVKLAHQGFWHEGLNKDADEAKTYRIKDGLRRCSESRKAHWNDQLSTGAIAYDQLADDAAKLRTLVELIHKRGEDTSALLYKWDRVGVPAAREHCGVSMQKIEATTAQLREELGSIEASVQSMNDKPATEPEPMTAIQGEAMRFMLDPLESAIESTVRMLDEGAVNPANTSSSIRMILLEHLRSLLAAQLNQATSLRTGDTTQ